ncbi:NAD-dependent epimerase/dehydratase family protein [Sphingomonas sp. HMP6]|uniref:NAD-dependent epimerase/dehydratase family protein n=1 Tax=Sphingomonas sp. HMP6 TaxID=1517551 RepID=UPI0015967A4E|nr:NAD-dependent epimerase/dehydratase family protein [Sphingomonas sp. HMP6]BCA57343.1 epimerase [Sphingomonas sp. HMP6]
MTTLAITGGTGFVGSRAIDLAVAAGHSVRALTRRPQPPRDGVTWIEGALDTAEPLDRLVDGADAVLHIAGVVNAPDRAGFAAGNIAGTQAVLDATRTAGVRRFVHVSSLAAREPDLSLYGWSKIESEVIVTASGLDWTIVRPPGIYGPGDMEMRDLFRMAKTGVAVLPPGGRVSVIHVDDIAALLLKLASADATGAILEPDDGRDGGWSHAQLIRAIGVAVGHKVVPLAVPKALLTTIAHADKTFRGKGAKLTPDRVGYLCHPDWTVDPARRPPPTLWQPAIDTPQGLAETAAWYRANGLL